MFYYAEHWEAFKSAVQNLDEEEASSVKIVKNLILDPALWTNIIFINTHLKNLPDVITALEARNMPVYDSLKLFDDTMDSLVNIPGDKGVFIKKKCINLVNKNKGLQDLKNIAKTFSDESVNFRRTSPLPKLLP